MTHAKILELINGLYASTGVGDFDTAEALYLSNDLTIEEASTLPPVAGIYTGVSALRDLYTKVFGLIDAAGLEVLSTCTDGEEHAVRHLKITYADPSLKPSEILEYFKIKDGKCCEIRPFYFEPKTFMAAYEAKKASKG